ncbi:MAG: anthranilate phosphoribosyltransferase [Myxococcota bacterium]
MSELQRAIADLVEGRSLTEARLASAIDEIVEGKGAPSNVGGFLIGLRMRGEAVSEIVAFARALRERATTAEAMDERTIDTCGTGGSGLDTFNISTTAAFVVSGAGVTVAKHGNRAVSSRSGSFDVFEALGVEIDHSIARCAEILNEIGIAPFFARTAHPAFKHLAKARADLGVRTLLNCLGPLLSPVRARYQLVGVYEEELVETMAAALLALGTQRALVVHGADGMDELTTTELSHAALVSDGKIQSIVIDPSALGIKPANLADLKGGSPEENAATIRSILGGEKGPRRDIVLLNAAAALWVVETVSSIEEGLVRAAVSIDEGAAAGKLEALCRATAAVGTVTAQ